MMTRPSGGSVESLLMKLDLFQKDVLQRFRDAFRTFTRSKPGMVPAPGGSGITRFLREDGTWAVP